MRIFETVKNCLARRRSIFYLLDANALLKEQFFRLGCWLSNRSYWNDSLRPKIGASGGISLARNLYAEALFEGVASVYRLRMPINDRHVALL